MMGNLQKEGGVTASSLVLLDYTAVNHLTDCPYWFLGKLHCSCGTSSEFSVH